MTSGPDIAGADAPAAEATAADGAHSAAQCFSGAVADHRAGRIDEAIAGYRRTLALDPGYAGVHRNLGAALRASGAAEEAVEILQQGVDANGDDPALQYNLGNALRDLGRYDEAVAAYEATLRGDSGFLAARNNMGLALAAARRLDDAEEAFRGLLKSAPDNPEIHNNLGLVFHDRGAYAAAEDRFRRALALKPDHQTARTNLGVALRKQNKLGEAVRTYEEVLERAPGDPKTLHDLALALKEQGRIGEAVARAGEAASRYPDALKDRMFLMQYGGEHTPEEVFAEHQRWADVGIPQEIMPRRDHANDRDPERKIRIGYVSRDFRRHSVSYFFASVLEAHDREVADVFLYGDVETADAMTNRLRMAADGWRDTLEKNDEELAAQIVEDEIDILVDLAGHTVRNRLLVFARKPAPVQATWLGYPNTTGLHTIDYRLTDNIADPEGEADRLHAERLVRLPGFLCYGPDPEAPEVAPMPAKEHDRVTFGSFNNLAKISSETLDVWAAILRAVPSARLVLKYRAFADSDTRSRLHAQFEERGIDRERIELRPRTATFKDHMASYNEIDIALDTFPYNGTTTTCEALWMGVPVVALKGKSHAGRVGASILMRLLLPTLVASSRDAYIARAIALASDLGKVEELRRTLRDRMSKSPLTDAASFTKALEAEYRVMWRSWCGGPDTGDGSA